MSTPLPFQGQLSRKDVSRHHQEKDKAGCRTDRIAKTGGPQPWRNPGAEGSETGNLSARLRNLDNEPPNASPRIQNVLQARNQVAGSFQTGRDALGRNHG